MSEQDLPDLNPCVNGPIGQPSPPDVPPAIPDEIAGTVITVSDQKPIKTSCMVDDVDGDGTNLVKYYDACLISVDDANVLTSTPLGAYTDECLTNSYAPFNPTDPSQAGSSSETKQKRKLISDATWSPSALTSAYTIRVISGSSATYTDSDGDTTPLDLGEVLTFTSDNLLMDTATVVTATAADQLVITSTETGAV